MKNLQKVNIRAAKKTHASKIAGKISAVTFIIIILLATYLPIMLIVIFSFSTTKSFGDFTGFKFTFKLFKQMFEDSEIMTALFNSLLVGGISSLLATFIGTFTAIGLFHSKKRLRSAIEYSGQITMFNADIVTALALLVFFVAIRLNNDWVRLIIAHTIICLPYVIMSILPRLSQLDPNVYEAGLDLGASPVRTLFTVILPQLMGGMIAGFALAFTISMDDFTISTFVSDGVETIPKYLYNKLSKGGLETKARALSTILLVAVMATLILINVFSAKRRKKQQQAMLSVSA